MPTIDALIFDFDGLIVDTEVHVYASWQALYQQHGHDLPVADWVAVLGMPAWTRDFAGELDQKVGQPLDWETLETRRKAHSLSLIEHEGARPGVEQWVADAVAAGLKLGVASGSSRNWVAGHLERLGLLEHFDHLTTRESTGEHKPNPGPFLHAAEQLGVSPERCLVLEDAPNGIRAAKAAGMWAIGVPGTLTRDVPLDGADLVLTDLSDMPLADAIAALG